MRSDRELFEQARQFLVSRRRSIEEQDRVYNQQVWRLAICSLVLMLVLALSSAFADPERVTLPFEPEMINLDPGLDARSIDRDMQVTIAWDWLRTHPERWPSWMSSKDTTGVPGITGPWQLVDWNELRARPHIWPSWMMERPTSRAPSEVTTAPKRGIYPSGCIECGHSCRITTATFGHSYLTYPPTDEVDEMCEHGHAWVRVARDGEVSYR